MARTGIACLRYTLCILNTILWVLGCGVLAAGIWLRVAYGGYASLLHQYSIISVDSMCLTVGIITFVLCFFACCGSWFESSCFIMTYFVLLCLVFVLQMLGSIVTFAFRHQVAEAVKEELKAGIRLSYNESSDNPLSFAWDHLQRRFECCGVESFEDWFNIEAWPEEQWVPPSCCQQQYASRKNCGKLTNKDLWYWTGCFDKVRMWFIQRLHIVGSLVLILTFIQLFGLLTSMFLFCSLRNRRRSRTYKSYQNDT